MHEEIEIRVHQEDARGNVYTLIKSIKWHGLTVPAGFESDGASVPRFFWRYVFPPGDSRAMFAAFIHDFIYRTHPQGWTRKAADEAFRSLLLEDGVSKSRARRAYWGVRLFGGSSWEAGGK